MLRVRRHYQPSGAPGFGGWARILILGHEPNLLTTVSVSMAERKDIRHFDV